MSSDGANPHEMAQRLDPHDVEKLLAGRVASSDAGLGPLAALLDRVRDEYPKAPDVYHETRHLALMLDAFEQQAPARRRRRPSARRTFAKIAIAVLATSAATGSALAATGNLPRPMQRVVANAVRHVGIDLPGARPHGRPASPNARSTHHGESGSSINRSDHRPPTTQAPGQVRKDRDGGTEPTATSHGNEVSDEHRDTDHPEPGDRGNSGAHTDHGTPDANSPDKDHGQGNAGDSHGNPHAPPTDDGTARD
jgi:hypothetical protein